jgi:CBS domain-containing protein
MGRIEGHFTREAIALDATASCRQAARLMHDRHIGAVVVRDGNRIIGLVTERDLVARVLATEADHEVAIGRVMRRDLPTVEPTCTETDCANLMRDHHTRHLLVQDGRGIAGIISMRDVIRAMLDEKQFLIEQLENYIRS